MEQSIFRLITPRFLIGELEDQIAEHVANELAQEEDEGTTPARIAVMREMVAAQSLSDVATLIVSVGGGAGIAAICAALAKAIKDFRGRHPTGKFKLEKDGVLIELDNLPYEKIHGLLEFIVQQQEPDLKEEDSGSEAAARINEPKVVEAFGLAEPRIIDGIYDPIAGRYYAPPIFESPLPPTDLPQTEESVMAFVDTGIMTHHPWIKGNIDDFADFTGEGIEDGSGHGTAATLVAISNYKGLTPDQRSPRLLFAKALNRFGRGDERHLIAALEWVAAKQPTVLHLSLGIYRDEPCKPDCRICGLVEQISVSGSWVVVAAGNDPDRHTCPHPRHFATQKVGAANPEGTAMEGYSGPGATFLSSLPPRFVAVES